MAKEMAVAIALKLKDAFSQNIHKAAGAASGFANNTLGAINKVDKALSGIGAKLAALGVSFSVGAATKEIIDLDANLMQMGVVAGMSTEQIANLKKELFAVSGDANIKIDYSNLEKAAAVITDLTGDTQFALDNFYLMGLAIRATGSDAAEIGALTAALKVAGLTAGQSAIALGTFAKQATAGSFTVRDFAAFGPRLISAYLATGRDAQKAMSDLGVLEAIRYGVGTSDQAATAFEAVLRNLSNPDKLKALKQFGVTVDFASQSIGEIMTAIIEATRGDSKKLYEWFDAEAVRAFNFGMSEYQRNLKESGRGFVESYTKYEKMAGSIQDLEAMAAQNAGTLKANLENLKSVFVDYVDSGGSGVLKVINDMLNALSQNPENIKKVFDAVAKGLISIAAVKGIAGISRLVGSLTQLKSGKVDITESLNMASAMPVYVTNWSGAPMGGAGVSYGGTLPGTHTGGGILDQYGNPVASPAPSPSSTPSLPGAPPRPTGTPAGSAVSTGLSMAPWFAAGAALTQAAFSTGPGKALLEKRSELDPAVPGSEYYYQMNPGARRAAWAKYEAEHPEEMTYQQRIDAVKKPGASSQAAHPALPPGRTGRWGGEKLGAWKNKTEKEFEDAQKQYEEACREAADVTGKTAEEILLINQRMDESLARLEKAKAAKDTEDLQKEKQRKVAEQLADRHMQGRYYRPTPEQPPQSDAERVKEGYMRRAGKYRIPATVPPAQTTRTGAGFNMDAAKETGKWRAGMYVPAADLPPQITQTRTGLIPQKVEIAGQAAIDVNVNLSGERPAARVSVKNNGIPNMRFNTGHAPWARNMP